MFIIGTSIGAGFLSGAELVRFFHTEGFFLPVMLGAVAMFAIGANAGLLRAIVGALSVAGVTLAARVAFPPVSYTAAIASILIVGFAGGIVSYIIGQHRLAALASTRGGIVLGDFI